MTHTDTESGAVPRTGAVINPAEPAMRQAPGTHESPHQPSDCTPTIVVDFAQEPEFPEKPNGDAPKVEIVRAQVSAYVDGYGLAKSTLPARILVNAADLRHCVRRILSRMQRPRRDKAKADWLERRKAGSKEKWRDARPAPLTDAALTWRGIPIEGVGYTRHRAVDKT